MPNNSLKNIKRTLFVFKNGTVFISEVDVNLLHGEWFEQEGWLKKEPDFIDKYPRGYFDQEGIYIYQGKDASLPKIDDKELKLLLLKLTKKININPNLNIYLGSTNKTNNLKKEPAKNLGTLKEFLNL